MISKAGSVAEVERIARIADMLCTAHASLRDRYEAYSLLLDLLLLFASAWLVSLAFIQPSVNAKLAPAGVDPKLWPGVLSVITFCLALLQLRVDWKARSDGHKRSAETYAEVKREARYALARGNVDEEFARIVARNDLASAVALPIPERLFLRAKQRHLSKIAVSKALDGRPLLWLPLAHLRLWWRDNFPKDHNER